MKKNIFVALLLVLATLCLTLQTVAFAQNETQDQLKNAVLQTEGVKDAEVVVYGDKCLVAIRGEFRQKSKFAAAKEKIETLAHQAFPEVNEVFVTASPKAFFNAKKWNEMTEEQKADLMNKFSEKIKDKIKESVK